MFNFILTNIGLNAFEINGYTKSHSNYQFGELILGDNTTSTCNILEVKGSYYIIFSSIYLNKINEEKVADFYFCAKPEHFIWNYLPKYPKWKY